MSRPTTSAPTAPAPRPRLADLEVRPDVFLVPEPARPIVALGLALPVGSLHDPPGKEGLAYLTAQMLIRGAGGRDHLALTEAMEELGSTFSVDAGRAHTTLTGDALTRNLDAFEDLAATILNQPDFPAAELDKLKRRTLAELAQLRDSDSALGQRFFLRTLFADHPYGRPLKGTPASIASITRDDVVAFYRAHYHRHGLLCGAAGDLDAPRLERLVERLTGPLPQAPVPPTTVPAAPRPQGLRGVLVDKPQRSQTQVFLGQPTLDVNHPDYLALFVGHVLFGGTFTARLSQEIRDKRGWSYGAYSYLATDQHLGTFTLRFYPAVADTLPAIELAHDLLTDLATRGATPADVAAAQRYLTNSHPFSLDTPNKRLHEVLTSRLRGRPADWLDRYLDRVAALTPADVNAALARHLHPADQVLTVVATASDLERPLRAWSRLASLDVVDYRAD